MGAIIELFNLNILINSFILILSLHFYIRF